MKAGQTNSVVLGIIFALAGIGIIVFHRSIKEMRDRDASRPFPLGVGEMWTGKYTRGGLIFTYAVIILFGLLLLAMGVVNIVGGLRA